MMRAVAFLLVVAGCLYSDKPPPCQYDYGAPAIAAELYRDPTTGQCQSFGQPCDPACGQACPAAEALPQPDWATCGGPCDGLAEAQCLATPTCHAAYQDSPTPTPTYWGCWGLPPSGPATGACTNLDAQTCSEHPDCTSLYTSPVNSGPNFVESFEKCNPKPDVTCATIDCGTGNECVIAAGSGAGVECQPIATGGTCGGLSCQQTPPVCPTMTTPGIGADGCYTGYCIPTDECTQPLCSSLTTEAQCTARTDCNPIYNGTNCTCDSHGCTCQTETFARCQ